MKTAKLWALAAFVTTASLSLAVGAQTVPQAEATSPPVQTEASKVASAAPSASNGVSISTTGNSSPAAVPNGPKDPESLTDISNRLQSGAATVSLDDLSKARDVIARLDLLMQIERRLSDIAKIRDERKKGSGVPMLPASALNLPSSMPTLSSMVAAAPASPPALLSLSQSAANASGAKSGPKKIEDDSDMPISVPMGHYSVDRVQGSNGKYAVTLSGGGGQETVYAGDKLQDGAVVKSVNMQEVRIKTRTGTEQVIKVGDAAGAK